MLSLSNSFILPSLLWHCCFGVRKSNEPVKIERWSAGVVVCLKGGASDCIWFSGRHYHPIVSFFIKIQISLTFLVPVYPHSPGKNAVKWVPVCCLIHSSVVFIHLITFRVRHSRGEMYIGRGHLCVCLSLAAFPPYCMDPGISWGMVAVPSSCAVLSIFAIGARVSLLWQHSAKRELSASACTHSMLGSLYKCLIYTCNSVTTFDSAFCGCICTSMLVLCWLVLEWSMRYSCLSENCDASRCCGTNCGLALWASCTRMSCAGSNSWKTKWLKSLPTQCWARKRQKQSFRKSIWQFWSRSVVLFYSY